MKYLFALIFLVLCAASMSVYLSFPDTRSSTPVIYWVTDANPARQDQVRLFHEWLIKQGHVTPDGKPIVELRLDSANRDVTKQIIQGVSGVGGDVMDLSGQRVRFFQSMGLLENVTEDARRMGFSPDKTYRAIEPDITVNGQQYLFPCNVYTAMYWVNKATLRKYDQPMPPARWTIEQFEQLGKAFVDAANPPGEHRTVFYTNSVNLLIMMRSLGLSVFNETMTRSTLDDERYIRCLKLQYKWTYEDHILPSKVDLASFDAESGYGGLTLQLFSQGNYATFMMGRYALIQLRKFGVLELAVVEPPHGGFPNTLTGTRGAAVYFGGANKDLAKLFLAYLAGEDYNMQIVRDADALPPNPMYARTEAFRRPPDHPNEWGCHEPFYDAAIDIALTRDISPFVLFNVMDRHMRDARDAVMADRLTPQQAAKQTADRINAEIHRSIEEDPDHKVLYEKRLKVQQQIDALRAAGKPVPIALISNPFHRRYYQAKGWTK